MINGETRWKDRVRLDLKSRVCGGEGVVITAVNVLCGEIEPNAVALEMESWR